MADISLSPGGLAALILGLVFGTLLLALAGTVAYLYLRQRRRAPRKPHGVDVVEDPGDDRTDGPTGKRAGVGGGPFRGNDRVYPAPRQMVEGYQNGSNEAGTVAIVKTVAEGGGSKKHRKGQPRMGTSYTTEAVNGVRDVQSVSLQGDVYTGLGFNVYGNCKDGIYVKDVLKRGPAHKSEVIAPGDRIMSLTVSFENMVLEDALTILSHASPYPVKLNTIRHAALLLPALKHALGEESGKLPKFHPLIRRHSVAERLGKNPVSKAVLDRPVIQHVPVDFPNSLITVVEESKVTKQGSKAHKVSFGSVNAGNTDKMRIINEIDNWPIPTKVHSLTLNDPVFEITGPHRISKQQRTDENPAQSEVTEKQGAAAFDAEEMVEFFQDPAKPDNLRAEMNTPRNSTEDNDAFWLGEWEPLPTTTYVTRLSEPSIPYAPYIAPTATATSKFTFMNQRAAAAVTQSSTTTADRTFLPWNNRRESEDQFWELAEKNVPTRIYLTKLVSSEYPYDPPAYSQSTWGNVSARQYMTDKVTSFRPHRQNVEPVVHAKEKEHTPSLIERMRVAKEVVFPETWKVDHSNVPTSVHILTHDAPYDPVESLPAVYPAEYYVSKLSDAQAMLEEEERRLKAEQARAEQHRDGSERRRSMFGKLSTTGWVGGSKKPSSPSLADKMGRRFSASVIGITSQDKRGPGRDRRGSLPKILVDLSEEKTAEEPVSDMKDANDVQLVPTFVHTLVHEDPCQQVDLVSAAVIGYKEVSMLERPRAGQTSFDESYYVSQQRVPDSAEPQIHASNPYDAWMAQRQVGREVPYESTGFTRLERPRIDYENPPIPEAVFGMSHSAPYVPPRPEHVLATEQESKVESQDVINAVSVSHTKSPAQKYFKLPEMSLSFGKTSSSSSRSETWTDPYGDEPRETYKLKLIEMAEEYRPVAVTDFERSEPEIPGFTADARSHTSTSTRPFVALLSDRREVQRSVIQEEPDHGSAELSNFYAVPNAQPIRHYDGYVPYYGAPPRSPPIGEDQKAALGRRSVEKKAWAGFHDSYVPPVVYNIEHNSPVLRLPEHCDGQSRQQMEQTRVQSAEKVRNEFEYEVPSVTYGLAHNNPSIPIGLYFSGLSRQEVERRNARPAASKQTRTEFNYVVPSITHDIEHNGPIIPLPRHYDGLSRQQMEQTRAQSANKVRNEFEYEVPSVTYDLAYNNPIIPIGLYGLPRREVERRNARPAASKKTRGSEFNYVVPSITHDIEHNGPIIPLPRHYDGLSRQQMEQTRAQSANKVRNEFEYEVPSVTYDLAYNNPIIPIKPYFSELPRQEVEQRNARSAASKQTHTELNYVVPSITRYIEQSGPNIPLPRHYDGMSRQQMEQTRSQSAEKVRSEFEYEVPSVTYDLAHNNPIIPIEPYFSGMSRPDVEQRNARPAASKKTRTEFSYVVPTTTHDIEHNGPIIPLPRHHDGMSRGAIEEQMNARSAMDYSRSDFDYDVPLVIHDMEHNDPGIHVPKDYDGLSRYQVDSLKYRVSSTGSPVIREKREDGNWKKRFEDVFSIKRLAKKSEPEHRPKDKSQEQRREKEVDTNFTSQISTSIQQGPVMRDEGTFEPVPYFLEGEEAGKVIFAYPMFHNAPGSEFHGVPSEYQFDRQGYRQKQAPLFLGSERSAAVNALTLTAPVLDFPSAHDAALPSATSQTTKRDTGSRGDEAAVKPRKTKSPGTDVPRSQRPYSTIIVLEGQRIPIYDMHLDEASEPYVHFSNPPHLGGHANRTGGYRSVANRIEGYRRTSPRPNEGFMATARPARIDPYQPVSERRSDDPYAELSYSDRLDVLRLSYDDNGVSKSTPDLVLQDESPRIERRMVDGRPPMREGTVRAEPLFVGRISPAGPYTGSRTRESSGSSVEMRGYALNQPPGPYDPRNYYDYARQARSRSRSPQIVKTTETIELGPQDTAVRETAYYTTAESTSAPAASTSRAGRPSQIHKRDSGYGTLAGEHIMIDTRARPGSTSPLSPASPISPSSLNQDQYDRLLHFQQQMMRQNDELNELGISVPYFEPLPPTKTELQRHDRYS